jgi:hypothetical protein
MKTRTKFSPIREYVTFDNGVVRFIIRRPDYAKNLKAHVQLLWVAFRDFGIDFLQFALENPDSLEFIVYGGERYRKTLGLEFNFKDYNDKVVVEKYNQVNQVEYTIG